MVHSIMRHVAETTGCNLEQLYGEVAWPLYKLYGHAYTAFAAMITDAEAEAVFQRLAEEAHGGSPPPILSQAVRDGILVNIRWAGGGGGGGGWRGVQAGSSGAVPTPQRVSAAGSTACPALPHSQPSPLSPPGPAGGD